MIVTCSEARVGERMLPVDVWSRGPFFRTMAQGYHTNAYQNREFAAAYDAWVQVLPPEVEVGQDVEFYTHFAESLKERAAVLRVLELACGTGRVLHGLQQKGLEISYVGIDNSKEMINQAKKKQYSEEQEASTVSAEFVVADMEEFVDQLAAQHKPPEFDLIIIPAGSIHHLLSWSSVSNLLSKCARLLASWGLLIVDFLPFSELCNPEIDSDPEHFGNYARHIRSKHVNADEQLITEEFTLRGTNGTEFELQWCLRWWTPEELRRLAQSVPLSVQACVHSFDLSAADNEIDSAVSDSQRKHIFVFHQREPDE